MIPNVTCLGCGIKKRVKPSHVPSTKYCSKKCQYLSPHWRDQQRKVWLGRKHSKSTIEKLRLLNKGRFAGQKSALWKGGAKNYWRNTVLQRDNFTCQKCGYDKNKRALNVDHIKSKILYPELATDISNGVTLCANCHAIKTYEDKEFRQYMSTKMSEVMRKKYD